MGEEILILTNAENGWDCLMSAHRDLESIRKFYTIPDHVKTGNDIVDYLNERDKAIYVLHKTTLL